MELIKTMEDNDLGLLKDYGPLIFSVFIILYSLFATYLDISFKNEDEDEN
jgi:hypothetical protein